MAFEIRKGESLRLALKRAGRAELKKARRIARDRAKPPTDRAHELRAAMKRARALVRLTRPAAGQRARAAERRLRACARTMAGLRDADVVLRTFDDLAGDLPQPPGPGVLALRARLAARLGAKRNALEAAGRFEAVAKRLRRRRGDIDSCLPGRDEDDWDILGPGLDAGYKRARRTMRRAYDRKSDAAFHDWRHAVKAYRSQLRFVLPLAPDALGGRVEQLGALGDLLGAEHDLVVLRETIAAQAEGFERLREGRALMRLLDRRRRELRARTRPLGEALFTEPPREVRRRFREDFRSFHA